ncbi:MAG: transposase [Bacteroidetes bacterium]|nr:transposase [Bacteroidota bacterium]
MSDKFQNKYRIASARLQTWDYRWAGSYFITICTQNREHFFGEIINGKMQLSAVGIIADILWHEIKNHAKNIELGEFVVMPNHIHGILILNGNDDNENGNTNVQTGHALSQLSQPTPESPVQTGHALSQLSQPTPESPVQTGHALSQLSQPTPDPTNRFQNIGKNSISSIIGGYKSAVSKHSHRLGYKFEWQTRFHDHIIRDEKSFHTISQYIINNPLKWDKDKFYK